MNLTKNISITILDKLILNGSIDEKNYKKTLYGLEIIISALAQIVGLVIIGMLMGILDKMIRVAFSFALLRAFAGGYHADTCLKCFMMTLVMCIGGIKLAELASTSTVSLIIISVASIVLVYKRAPVETSHKPMTEKGRRKNRKRSIMILLTLLSIAMCVYTISSIDKLYPALIISGLFMESLSLLVSQNERGRIDD
jgi:accessory gene regulator B